MHDSISGMVDNGKFQQLLFRYINCNQSLKKLQVIAILFTPYIYILINIRTTIRKHLKIFTSFRKVTK